MTTSEERKAIRDAMQVVAELSDEVSTIAASVCRLSETLARVKRDLVAMSDAEKEDAR